MNAPDPKKRPNPEASYKTGRRGNSMHLVDRNERHRLAYWELSKAFADLNEPCYWANPGAFDLDYIKRTPLDYMDARIAAMQNHIANIPEAARGEYYGYLEVIFRVRRLLAELDAPELK